MNDQVFLYWDDIGDSQTHVDKQVAKSSVSGSSVLGVPAAQKENERVIVNNYLDYMDDVDEE